MSTSGGPIHRGAAEAVSTVSDGPHQIRTGIFAGAHKITNSFDLLIGHLYRGNLTEPQQLGQVRGIAGIFSELNVVNCEDCHGVRASWMVSAMRLGRVGGGASGGVVEGGDGELDGGGATGGDLVHLGEFG